MDIEVEAWLKYPQYHQFFNKLWFNEQVGNLCGPAHVPVKMTNQYVIRPIYNLLGMGAHTTVELLEDGQTIDKPGFFWCQLITGMQYTADFIHQSGYGWIQANTFAGIRENGLTPGRFIRWIRSEKEFTLPECMEKTLDPDVIYHVNVEYIGNRPIECHLRGNPDPVMYDWFDPIWSDQVVPRAPEINGEDFILSIQPTGDKNVTRIGFVVGNNKERY